MGGLIISQLITLYITPVVYLWLEWFQENVLDRVPFLRSGHMSASRTDSSRGEHHEGDAAKPPLRVDEPAPAGVH